MKKLLAMILMLALAASAGGCSGDKQKPTPKPSASPVKSSGPVEKTQVSIGMWDLGKAVSGTPSGEMMSYFADVYGVEFVPWPVTSQDWKEKIDAAAAAKALPDMFVHGIYNDALSFKSLVDQKLIREIPESIYKEYHSLGTMMYRYRNTEALDGKMYFVPRADMALRYDNGRSVAIWYRLDWALQSKVLPVGQEPSWQDFMNLMGYFSHGDLDRNGSDDTWSLTAAGPGLGGLKTAFFTTFGVRDWVLEGGKWIPGMLSLRAKEALKWANQAFRSGYIDANFSTQTQEDAITKFCSGKAGMLVADASPQSAERINAMLQLKLPGVDIRSAVSVLPQPLNPWGVAYNEDTSYSTGIVFSATVDDGKLKKILRLMDWMMSKEGLTWAGWGEKGKDYNVTGDGLQTLHKDANGLPVTVGQLNVEWSAMKNLSTWGRDFVPAANESDYRLKYMDTLKKFWWSNNWRRPMFTRYIMDASVQSFDSDGRAEAALAEMIMHSSDIEADWQAYVSRMNAELNVDAVAKVVNDYAQKNNIKTEE